MKKPSLDQSPLYKRFIEGRDKALEVYLSKFKTGNAKVIKTLSIQLHDAALGLSAESSVHFINAKRIQDRLTPLFMTAMVATYHLQSRLLKNSHLLAYWGEAEAIGQALGRKTKVSHKRLTVQDKSLRKIEYHYNQLLRKVCGAIELGVLMGDSPDDLAKRAVDKLPKIVDIPKTGRELRSLYREAADDSKAAELKKPKIDFSDGFIDDQDWEQAFQDYVKDDPWYTTYTRSEDKVQDDSRTEWELERDITTDFVTEVRNGQNDAANENGIVDMMWISVSHKTLCDHCEWRDGLTSKEIEAKLEQMGDDEPDAITPPAHPFCYCRLAPVTQDLIDATPDSSISKEFDEWLMS